MCWEIATPKNGTCNSAAKESNEDEWQEGPSGLGTGKPAHPWGQRLLRSEGDTLPWVRAVLPNLVMATGEIIQAPHLSVNMLGSLVPTLPASAPSSEGQSTLQHLGGKLWVKNGKDKQFL